MPFTLLSGNVSSLAGFPEEHPIQACKASVEPDNMFHYQAMRQPDAKEFRKVMQKEWDDQLKNGKFTVIHRSEIPEGVQYSQLCGRCGENGTWSTENQEAQGSTEH
jgi:hypothetical protein